MKKTVLFLSALALAANVYAADKFEAGTADAPNYYVLKAGRGTPYLAYSEDPLEYNSSVEVNLYRTDVLSEANIWEVTPGEAEGTVKVVAYGTTRGLMNYVKNDGSGAYYGSGAVATAVNKVKDIYPIYNANGTVSLAINNAAGKNGDEYYTLDAPTNGIFLGNWIPNDEGTRWTAYKVDMTNGVEAALAGAQTAIYADLLQALVTTYTGFFNTYINAVPWVKEELQEGIDALNKIEPTADYEADVVKVWGEYTSKGTAKLNTMFDGKELAFMNLRRAAGGLTPYAATDTVAGSFKMVASYVSNDSAAYTLEAAEFDGTTGYLIYNAANKVYLQFDTAVNAIKPIALKENATVVRFILNTNSGYTGVNMVMPEFSELNVYEGWGAYYAINADTKEVSKMVPYWAPDGGSIWSLLDASKEGVVKDAIAAATANLKAYVPALPEMVANILTAAIDELEAIDPKTTTGDAVEEIAAKALADANELLATGMNGIDLTIKNLRKGQFLSVGAEDWVYSVYNDVEETLFTFKAQADGGYILYNAATETYVGPVVDSVQFPGSQTDIEETKDEASALVLYPFLCNGGEFYGVAMALEANPTAATTAFNMNSNTQILHTYRAGDAGSIFGLLPFGSHAGLEAVAAPANVKLQGIYDLQGRKLAAPVKGINIINGQKVLVK